MGTRERPHDALLSWAPWPSRSALELARERYEEVVVLFRELGQRLREGIALSATSRPTAGTGEQAIALHRTLDDASHLAVAPRTPRRPS